LPGHAGSSCAKSHHDTSRCTNYPLNTASSRQFALGFRTPDLTDAIEFPILQDREQHRRQGREILDREIARLNVKDVAAVDIARQLKQDSSDALCIALGAGNLTSASIATALQHLRGTGLPATRPRRQSRRKDTKPNAAAVTGIGDLMCNFARCCRPVPPEPIIGYITQGRGVSIHRQDCGNYLGLHRRYPERSLETGWGQSDAASYPVDLTLHAFDRSGLIRDITTVLADEEANVVDLKTYAGKESLQVVMELSIEIRDLPTLSTAITRLEQLPNVVSVRRKA